MCDTYGPATISMSCNGTPDKVSGFVSREYDSGTYINEVDLKDEALLLEEIVADGTFLDIRLQGMFSYILSRAGVSKKKFSSISYLIRKMLPIRK